MLSLLLKILALLSILYLLLALYAWLASDSMLYHPEFSRQPEPPGTFRLRTADGDEISAVHLRNDPARLTVLFSYGNASSLGNSYEFMLRLRSLGFSVLGYEYSGYGAGRGKPSERALYADIDAAYSCLVDSLGVPPERIVAFGQSLGGAVACDLASRRKLGGLIIESSFVSAFRVMTRVPLLPFDRFASIGKIGKVRCPVLVVHGDRDRTIPLWHGKALFGAAHPPKKMLVVPGGEHLSAPQGSREAYYGALTSFTAAL